MQHFLCSAEQDRIVGFTQHYCDDAVAQTEIFPAINPNALYFSYTAIVEILSENPL